VARARLVGGALDRTAAEPSRIGIIGAGGVALRHAAALAGFPDVVVAGVADPAAERAAALASRVSAGNGDRSPPVSTYPGAAEMIAHEPLDAVYVCVPPFAHGAPERQALEAGLPMFVEKPLALDVAAAAEIAAGVAERHLVTATGYHWRYYDTVEEAAAVLAGRQVRLAVASWLDKVPPVGWWTRLDRSGGQVVEQATHLLDLLRVLVGEVRVVQAVGAPPAQAERSEEGAGPAAGAAPARDVDEAGAATLQFASGAVGAVLTTSVLGWKAAAGLQLYADGLVLALAEDELTVDRGAGPQRRPPTVDAKTAGDRAFVDAVRGADPTVVRAPYAEALRTHRLACAVAEAAATGRAVECG